MTYTPEFNIWTSMKMRCENPNHHAYASYGGRGIKVCERWKNSFPNFIADMGYRPSSEYSIERIKVNEGYNPDNCKWIPKREQPKNTRATKLIEYNGEKLARGVFIIPLENANKVVLFLKKNKIKNKIFLFWKEIL